MHFNEITGSLLTSSLDTITVNATAACRIQVLLHISPATGTAGYRLITEGTYYPTDGSVTLYDLADALEQVMERWGVVTGVLSVSSTISGATEHRTALVRLCRIAVADDYLDTHFATLMNGDRRTAPGQTEVLSTLPDAEGPGEITATYVNTSTGAVSHYTHYIAAIRIEEAATIGAVAPFGNGIYAFAFDPADYLRPLISTDTGILARLSLRYGRRRATYIVNYERPAAATAFLFLNAFGLPETLYCTGTHAAEPSYERQHVRIGGSLEAYDIRQTDTRKAYTGPLTPAEAEWATELLRARRVWVIRDDGLQPVIITDAEARRDNQDATMAEYVITYRPSTDRTLWMDDRLRHRIFDSTFDTTFE